MIALLISVIFLLLLLRVSVSVLCLFFVCGVFFLLLCAGNVTHSCSREKDLSTKEPFSS